MIIVLAIVLSVMTSCKNTARNTNGVPCEALIVVKYDSIEPLDAEIEVVKNNLVIEEVCR